MGTEDIQNKAEEWKGAAKETVGDVTDNEDLQAEGEAEKNKAKAKEAYEDIKDDVKGAVENVKDAIHDKTS
jgi:uncharacterized protein YjbJ (UPF0337 family)